MHDLETRRALDFPLPFLAEAFAAGFEGYFVPMSADARAFEQRVRTEHIHLADSHVVLQGGRAVALALAARRGARSRVAALGVVPALRKAGLGRALTQRLVDEARERGDRELVLEVFEQNAPALGLYRALGFEVVRRLVGWEGTPAPHEAPLEEAPLTEALAALAQHGAPGLPWQLAPETVAGLTPPTRAWRLGHAVAVVADAKPGVRTLRALVVPAEHRRTGEASRLLGALAAARPGTRLEVPPLVPAGLACDFFAAAGLERSAFTLLELVRPLGR